MHLNPAEVSELLKKKISELSLTGSMSQEGVVISVSDGIVRIYGLADVMQGEMLSFDNSDIVGLALNLERDCVGAVLFGHSVDVREGDIVRTTGRIFEVPVGEALIGRVVNALGEPIDNQGPVNSKERRPVERVAPGVIDRQSVSQPLQTGLKAIDAMVPVGRGLISLLCI